MMLVRILIAAVCSTCLLQEGIGEELLYEQRIRPIPFQISVPVTIGAQVLSFVFDTGAGAHMIDPQLQGFLHNELGKYAITGSGGEKEVRLFEAPSMRIGTWAVPSGRMGVFDCAPIRNLLGTNLRGILGNEAIQKVSVDVDFDKAQLRLLRNSKTSEWKMSRALLRMSPTMQVPAINVGIEKEELEVLVDTGSNECIGLRHERFEKLVADGTIKRELGRLSVSRETITGQHKTSEGRFVKGKLLGLELKDMPVTDTGNIESLGMEFLINFNFVIDLPNGAFYFQKRNAEPPLRHNLMFGAALSFIDGHCRVLALASGGGPAQDVGLKQGDEIVKIDPLSGKDLCLSSIYELCLNKAGQTIDVEFLHTGDAQPIKTRLVIGKKQFLYPPR